MVLPNFIFIQDGLLGRMLHNIRHKGPTIMRIKRHTKWDLFYFILVPFHWNVSHERQCIEKRIRFALFGKRLQL